MDRELRRFIEGILIFAFLAGVVLEIKRYEHRKLDILEKYGLDAIEKLNDSGQSRRKALPIRQRSVRDRQQANLKTLRQ